MRLINIAGISMGGVTCIKHLTSRDNRVIWLWRCHCGKEFERGGVDVRRALKKNGKTSCGCNQIAACTRNGKNNKTHGFSHSKRLYDVYRQMIKRCSNPKCKDYKYYGERKIKVCKKWHKIKEFFIWAKLSGYKNNLTLDRIDNNGNYKPSNCRWIPMSEQAKNTRRCKFIKFNGYNLNMSDWARKTGIRAQTISQRINNGWSIEKTLTSIPVKGRNQLA